MHFKVFYTIQNESQIKYRLVKVVGHFKKWLKDNNIEVYSTHNEGKSVVSERFIRTLKN